MPLAEMRSDYRRPLQGGLFPGLEEGLGPLGAHHRQFVTVIETVRLIERARFVEQTLRRLPVEPTAEQRREVESLAAP